MTVLIVDDSKVARKILKDELQSIGHSVIAEAKDGLEGVELCNLHKPDLVISDIEMPKLDGVAMVSQIRRRNKNIKIIMITSVVNKKVTQQALLHGASSILTKPIDIKLLMKAIEGKS